MMDLEVIAVNQFLKHETTVLRINDLYYHVIPLLDGTVEVWVGRRLFHSASDDEGHFSFVGSLVDHWIISPTIGSMQSDDLYRQFVAQPWLFLIERRL